MTDDKEKNALDIEWEQRTLCSDESCIGTIGPDGCCRECGTPFEGDLPVFDPETHDPSDAEDDAALAHDGEDDSTESEEYLGEDEPESDGDIDDEWEKRTLCSDESCIGVIGPDGRCKECGKPLK